MIRTCFYFLKFWISAEKESDHWEVYQCVWLAELQSSEYIRLYFMSYMLQKPDQNSECDDLSEAGSCLDHKLRRSSASLCLSDSFHEGTHTLPVMFVWTSTSPCCIQKQTEQQRLFQYSSSSWFDSYCFVESESFIFFCWLTCFLLQLPSRLRAQCSSSNLSC